VYQVELALLLAVDPAAPDGDRLVGYQLVSGSVKKRDVAPFLARLQAAGIQPDPILTDGSSLYPTLLKRYPQWQDNPAYQAVGALHKIRAAVDGPRFAQLSQLLHHPTWEATNNGAERAGRAFRHVQGPHFNLRTPESINLALAAQAPMRKDTIVRGPARRRAAVDGAANRGG
jgi:hypothetical protein